MPAGRPRLGVALLAVAAVLLVARLGTGIDVSDDSAEVFLVVKGRPAWAVYRKATDREPLGQDWILDGDEQALAYEGAYVALMRAPPAAAAAAVAWLLARRRGGTG